MELFLYDRDIFLLPENIQNQRFSDALLEKKTGSSAR